MIDQGQEREMQRDREGATHTDPKGRDKQRKRETDRQTGRERIKDRDF